MYHLILLAGVLLFPVSALAEGLHWYVHGTDVERRSATGGSNVERGWPGGSPYNYSHLVWHTIETDHFFIHYHEGAEWTANKIASIADRTYDLVTEAYDYPLDEKVHVVVRDIEEVANGWAIASQNWMTIWATNLYHPLRGRHYWIDNVFPHEFTHIVSIKAANIFNDHFPGIDFIGLQDWGLQLGPEFDPPDARLSKVPVDLGVSFFLPGESVPPWFAEGVAQYHDMVTAGFESWDTHRDMFLRMAVLDDNVLTLDEMGTFTGRNSMQAEQVYNQGFSFVTFLAGRIPEVAELDADARIARKKGKAKHLLFESSIRSVLKEDADDLYEEWRVEKESEYAHLREVLGELREGVEFNPSGQEDWFKAEGYEQGLLNRDVRISPDGRYRTYLSSRGSERWGTTLYLVELENGSPVPGKEPKAITSTSAYSWSPDSSRLAYVSSVAQFGSGVSSQKIFVYDIETEKSEVLAGRTDFSLGSFRHGDFPAAPDRAGTPAWSPDGQWIAYTHNADGRMNVRMVHPDGTGDVALTQFEDGTQTGGLSWSPDGKRILCFMFRNGRQDIWTIDVEARSVAQLTDDRHDDRDPAFSRDGSKVIFSSDRSGVFNLYELDLDTLQTRRITNMVGGAFWPTYSEDGTHIRFSSFTSKGHRLREIALEDPPEEERPEKEVFDVMMGWDPLALNALPSAPYVSKWRPFTLFPVIEYFNEQVRGGIGIRVGDFLNRHAGIAFASVGSPVNEDPSSDEIDQFYQGAYLNQAYPLSWHLDGRHFLLKDVFGSGANTLKMDQVADFIELGTSYPLASGGGGGGAQGHSIGASYLFRNVIARFAGGGQHTLLDNALADLFRQVGEEPPVGCLAQDGAGNLIPGKDTVCLGNKHTIVRNHQGSLTYAFGSSSGATDAGVNPRNSKAVSVTYAYTRTEISEFIAALNEARNKTALFDDGNRVRIGRLPQGDYEFSRLLVSHSWYLPSPIRWIDPGLDRLRHTFYYALFAGLTDRPVAGPDKFFAGGRLNVFANRLVNPFLDLPGYEDFQVGGDAMLIASVGYRFPILRKINIGFGPFYFGSLYGTVFGDVGNGYDLRGKGPFVTNIIFDKNGDRRFGRADVLEDAGAELLLEGDLFHFEGAWNSFIRIAKGFSPVPGLTREVPNPFDPAAIGLLGEDTVSRKEAPLRVYVGLGIGF